MRVCGETAESRANSRAADVRLAEAGVLSFEHAGRSTTRICRRVGGRRRRQVRNAGWCHRTLRKIVGGRIGFGVQQLVRVCGFGSRRYVHDGFVCRSGWLNRFCCRATPAPRSGTGSYFFRYCSVASTSSNGNIGSFSKSLVNNQPSAVFFIGLIDGTVCPFSRVDTLIRMT